MLKKTWIIGFVCLVLLTQFLSAQTEEDAVIQSIMNSSSTRGFSGPAVTDREIEQILLCGMKAPSARNSQLWRFVVLGDSTRTEAILAKRIGNVTYDPGTVYIIVCGAEKEAEGIDVDFDCALAAENMYIAAQSLGLGAHIYTSPVRALNSALREEIPLPDGYRAVCLIKIGHTDIDTVSSASPRKGIREIVDFR